MDGWFGMKRRGEKGREGERREDEDDIECVYM